MKKKVGKKKCDCCGKTSRSKSGKAKHSKVKKIIKYSKTGKKVVKKKRK